MSDPQQAKFEGWAIVDVLGHQRYVGYVTTEAYGSAVLFRTDVPALQERERVTKRPGYVNGQYLPAGATVKEGAIEGYTKLVGSGSIYTITPCTKDAALHAVEESQPRPLMSVALPPDRGLSEAAGADPPDDDDALNDAGPHDDISDDGDEFDDGDLDDEEDRL
jgi:hypothetical protein